MTEDQARDGLSLPAQQQTRGYAARLGWSIAGEFADILSGTRDDRPGYVRLLAEARRHCGQNRPVVVVVSRLDRSGRSVLERARSAEELRSLGTSLRIPVAATAP